MKLEKPAIYIPAPEKVEEIRQLAAQDPEKFNNPHPIHGVYDLAGNFAVESKFWFYKCWIKQLEVAEPGSGLEEYFRTRDLRTPLPPDFHEEKRLTLSSGGDLMAVDCLCDQYTEHLFDGIRDFYFGADLTTANLESNIYSKGFPGRDMSRGIPAKMNTSQGMFERFFEGGKGIEYFSRANNHCYDYDFDGLVETDRFLDEHACWHSGTNSRPQDQPKALVFERGGIRMAHLSATCDMNGRHYDEKWAINEVRFNDEVCDLSLVEKQVQSAHEQNADVILMHAHWGWEFEMYPHTNIVAVAHKMAEMGVDIIIGTHPHVAQPMEIYEYEKDGQKKRCLIVYSLGDFVSFHPISKNSKLTFVVRYDLVKGTRNGKTETYFDNLKMLPVYINCAQLENGDYDCRLLKFSDVLKDAASDAPKYHLTPEERADLPRLANVVLKTILLPADPGTVLGDDYPFFKED